MEKRESDVGAFQDFRGIRAAKRQQATSHAMLCFRIALPINNQVGAKHCTQMLKSRRLPIQANVEHAG